MGIAPDQIYTINLKDEAAIKGRLSRLEIDRGLWTFVYLRPECIRFARDC
jgi:hypothetical protein